MSRKQNQRIRVIQPVCIPILAVLCSSLLVLPPCASAVTMVNDPHGFQGNMWGTPLVESTDLIEVGSGDRIKEYELKQNPPRFGETVVESMRFSTIDGKFARVAIRYHGKQTHMFILTHLQSQFGPLDLTPGQLAGGSLQQFDWRGKDTQINLTYEVKKERGIIFFESRALAPRFTEDLGGQ